MPATASHPRATTEPLAWSYAHPAVRDLAFLLLVPSPFAFLGSEQVRPRLLGADGRSRLAALDAAPAALDAWLAAHPVTRLGRYAEILLLFWCHHARHIELLAYGLPVRAAHGQTLGEFDFLLRVDGEPWHLELACKFYLQLAGDDASLVGPALNDAWPLKARKLGQQLALSARPEAQALLPAGFAGCTRAVLLSGWRFFPPDWVPERPPASGWFAPLGERWPQRAGHSRWAWLARRQWLAPACLDGSGLLDSDALRPALANMQQPQLLAELVPGPAGCWHEVARGFVVPPAWPEPGRLASLQANIAVGGKA